MDCARENSVADGILVLNFPPVCCCCVGRAVLRRSRLCADERGDERRLEGGENLDVLELQHAENRFCVACEQRASR